MFKVYWTDPLDHPKGKCFEDMSKALQFAQDLRNIFHRKFVTLCSENPDCTSLPGVSEVSSDYSWKKRRI
jgi:hypothetical protein